MMDLLRGTWRPALEILILAVGIYYVFSYVRGSRGWPVFTGFLVILLTLVIGTGLLNLQVLRWLMQTFFFGIAIAALVIFQPELRRMLGEVGRIPLFNISRQERENIEVIVEAAEIMSEARIGALIAIEQSIHLQSTVESGIVVDCEATPEMLETIFFPNNAIHDGGVIIKGNRILQAACIYPLTRRQDLSKSMGTRHRAAIGLSEETDAIVVVVSEETGSISYAYKGELVRGVTLEELRAFLSALLVKTSKPRGFKVWWNSWILKKVQASGSAPAKTQTEP